MPTLQPDVIRQTITMILSEAYDGVSAGGQTWFNDDGLASAWLGLLGTLPADVAAWPAGPGRKSIAQHVRHTRFHLETTLKFLSGDRSHNNWNTSWDVDARDEAAWRREIEALRAAYLAVRKKCEEIEWDLPQLGSVIGTIAHAAYHLGAVRQMLRERVG